MEQGTLRIENRAVPDLVPLVWDTPGIEAAIPKDAVGQALPCSSRRNAPTTSNLADMTPSNVAVL